MNNNQTWPCTSSSSPFSSLPLPTNLPASDYSSRSVRLCSRPPPSKPPQQTDFSSLPYDVLIKIAASFDQPNLQSASLVCRSWSEALRPLREAMMMLMWGKRFKHGKRGVRQNIEKALDMFTKAAARGSALAMVDAGLIYWERGDKVKALDLYLMAAQLGNSSAQCNLGISYLQVEPPNTEQALKWLYKASKGGNIRAQYQLALCLHRDGGKKSNIREAVKWYMKAAEGGYVRAMYNISLCYSVGEGLSRNHQVARKWMKRAADRGHSKAQFEHGLALYSQLAELPKCFVREFGDVIDPYVILRDPNNNEFEVHVIKRSRKMYFQDGWIGLKDVYDMRFGAWVRFTYRDPRLLTIRVTTRWGEEVKYPASNPPLRRLLSRVGFDIESGFPKSSFSSSANVISNSFVRSYVKELTYHDVHSGVLVLPWFGFGEHVFAFAHSDLVLVDHLGDRFNCILKFGVNSDDELSCKVSGAWSDLCKAHCLVKGDRVRFCVAQPSHNYMMYVCVYPQVGIQTTLTYPLDDGSEIPLYVSQQHFIAHG